MQICTLPQTDNHAGIPPLSFLQAGCPSCHPTNSVKAMKVSYDIHYIKMLYILAQPVMNTKLTEISTWLWTASAGKCWLFQVCLALTLTPAIAAPSSGSIQQQCPTDCTYQWKPSELSMIPHTSEVWRRWRHLSTAVAKTYPNRHNFCLQSSHTL